LYFTDGRKPRQTVLMRFTPIIGALLPHLGPSNTFVRPRTSSPQGASHFTGEMAKELAKLVDSGTIRLLDVVILAKDADGTIEALEIDDLEQLDELRTAETQLAQLLAAEDITHLAAAMEPGTTAGVLVWENTWAAPFASAARRSGGQLIVNGRIPIQAILASLEADEKGD
jgi:Family of unknown function (DUF6325)